MIVYGEFTDDVISNAIEARILAAFQQRLGDSTAGALGMARRGGSAVP